MAIPVLASIKPQSAIDRLAIALDYPTAEQAGETFDRLQGRAGLFKVGSELFLVAGPPIVRSLVERGARVFLDLKFHDIPRTVAAAAREAARLGVAVFNVHATGGIEMMRAAAHAARAVRPEIKVLGVTVLTSLPAAEEDVLQLAEMAQEAGLDGVVTSPSEAAAVRRNFGKDFVILVPGIRPAWAASQDDQKRVATPSHAISAGADYIVVGRPITAAADPVAAAARVEEEISAALS
jgi:orotidine-5'-phosphate decarboxylase